MQDNPRLDRAADNGDTGATVRALRPVHLTLEDAMSLACLARLELMAEGWAPELGGELIPPPNADELDRQNGEALTRLDDAIARQILEQSAAYRRREASRHPVSAPPEGHAS